MKLAFLISAHTDAQHLLRLINCLPSDSDKYIHIDLKADINAFSAVAAQDNVQIINERYNVMWGSFLQVNFQRALMRAALSSGVNYDYLITLSGLDYPLWSNERILRFFEQNKGREFIQGVRVKEQGKGTRLYKEYRFLNNHCWKYDTLKSKFRVAIRKIVYALGFCKPLTVKCDGICYDLYKGSDWWAITGNLAKYFMDFYDTHPAFIRYFKNSFSPNETIWQTIAFHSEFADRCILSVGIINKLEELTPLTYIGDRDDIKILTEDDFDTLFKSDKMFCRKVVTGKSDKLMDMIDNSRQSIGGKSMYSHPLDGSSGSKPR